MEGRNHISIPDVLAEELVRDVYDAWMHMSLPNTLREQNDTEPMDTPGAGYKAENLKLLAKVAVKTMASDISLLLELVRCASIDEE